MAEAFTFTTLKRTMTKYIFVLLAQRKTFFKIISIFSVDVRRLVGKELPSGLPLISAIN